MRYRAYEGQEVDGLVRLLSCGHDGQLALWDFDTSPEALSPVRCEYGNPLLYPAVVVVIGG